VLAPAVLAADIRADLTNASAQYAPRRRSGALAADV
jgi:hypothetical protein